MGKKPTVPSTGEFARFLTSINSMTTPRTRSTLKHQRLIPLIKRKQNGHLPTIPGPGHLMSHVPFLKTRRKFAPDFLMVRCWGRFLHTKPVYTLRIQVCPKERNTPTFLFYGCDWNPQSYSREGSGFLGIYIYIHILPLHCLDFSHDGRCFFSSLQSRASWHPRLNSIKWFLIACSSSIFLSQMAV